MILRRQQIRTEATAVRARYAGLSGMPAPARLPLEELVEQGYLLTAFDDPALDPRINGELNPQLGTIRLRPGMPESRRRFVIAHELGHYLLEGLALALYEDDDTTLDEYAGADFESEAGVLRAYNSRERREQEANLFALELLIPADQLRQALQTPGWSIETLAGHFGVSRDALCIRLVNVICLEPAEKTVDRSTVHRPPSTIHRPSPDPYQQAAVTAPLPTLVVAGPGTGKTRTIVEKYLALIAEGVSPAHILALTFSNKAAEEMHERISAALAANEPSQLPENLEQAHPDGALPSTVHRPPSRSGTAFQKVTPEVSTFHAWGLNFLKQYGHHLGLPLAIRLCSAAEIYVLLRRRLADLPLAEYKDLRQPGLYLRQIIAAIGRAKDELCDPQAFHVLAEAEAERLLAEAAPRPGTKATKTAQQARARAVRDAARLRELAAIYARYQAILREEGVLDYGDLLMASVAALQIPAVAAAVHSRHHYILVDEFQDINYASGELVRLIDGGRGRVWAVGDPWQSIYRFRGASPANLAQFAQVYPTATERDLARNYRSFQPILDAAHAIMAPDPLFERRAAPVAGRGSPPEPCVAEWLCDSPEAEASAIAHAILRRVRSPRRLPPCARPNFPRFKSKRSASPTHRFKGKRAPSIVHRPPSSFGDHAVLCRTHAQAERIAAVLRAHGIPVALAGSLLDAPEVKDALAIGGLAGGNDPAALLRALTIPEHALPPTDLAALIDAAANSDRPLAQIISTVHRPPSTAHRPPSTACPERSRRVHRPLSTVPLSPTGRERLTRLLLIAERITALDAWQALVRYLFEERAGVREQIVAAAGGDFGARRSLALLGQLLGLARAFVRQAPEEERGPGHFVAYVRLLIEAGETINAVVPEGQGELVQVLTVHAAKGLEYPFVYLPALQEGVFPSRRQGSSIPELAGLVHGEREDEAREERYLLYVAMTRARDRLILSRAAARGGKALKRSSLLPGGEDGTGASWPLLHLPPQPGCPTTTPEERLTITAPARAAIPVAALESYERCPRRYFYQYGLQLEDETAPYLQMHRAIGAVLQELTRRAGAAALPEEEAAVRELVQEALTKQGLAEVLYSDDYQAEAQARVLLAWRDLRTTRGAAEPASQSHIVRRSAGAIRVRVDRVEPGESGPRWVRVRSGREGEDDHLSMTVMLYALAYEQAHGRTAEITLHYSASGTQRITTPRRDVLARRSATIDELLVRIAAGDFTPAPGPQCGACPFNLLCPA